MSSNVVFSQTLQNITRTKLNELDKKREIFEKAKIASIKDADRQKTPLDMLVKLADGCKVCFLIESTDDGKVVFGSGSKSQLELDLSNLSRFVDQARFDPSVSLRIIHQWREVLLHHLEVQSLKFQYADLYGKLTVEWLSSSPQKPDAAASDALSGSESFQKVAVKAKLQAKQDWESEVFEGADVDRSAIRQLLEQLFQSKDSQRAFEKVRNCISDIQVGLGRHDCFDIESLNWTIKSLLASDRLTNENRQALRDFQSSNVILIEIADVLNMRLAALDSWSWGDFVNVEVRRRLNGEFDVHMQEDLLQAIFLQYIGLMWTTKVKFALTKLQEDHSAWKYGRQEISPIDKQRRRWFLPSHSQGRSVEHIRNWTYRCGFYLNQLQDRVDQEIETEQGDEEAKIVMGASLARPRGLMMKRVASLPGGYGGGGLAGEEEDEDDEICFSPIEDPAEDLSKFKPKNSMDARQRLLHLLSTEILLRTRLDGEITCFRSQFKSLQNGLPHASISTVLSFFGISDKWQKFFSSFLKAPLKFQDEDESPRRRKRGTPRAHIISDLFSELLLFILDYRVNQETNGELLWRINDDFWFWSTSHESCIKAWETIQSFSRIMGIEVDDKKSANARMQQIDGKIRSTKSHRSLPTGQIRWGMIVLNPATGKFTIDQNMVDQHTEELRRQLQDKEQSILSWVQAYSTYASTFFTTNFGRPSNCFGRSHLDQMLSMHERVQRTLFNSDETVDSVVGWLKSQIEKRFGVSDIPDGYFFFPSSLGGLEVKSPFVSLMQLRESVTKDPAALVEEFLKAEKDQYDQVRRLYLQERVWEYPRRGEEYRPEDPEQFMPFEEYTRFRQDLNYGFSDQLVDIYQQLLRQPVEEALLCDSSSEIYQATARLPTVPGQTETITDWYGMSPYWKWITMLYGPEILERFDGLEVVDAALLPMGMVSIFKKEKVNWQE